MNDIYSQKIIENFTYEFLTPNYYKSVYYLLDDISKSKHIDINAANSMYYNKIIEYVNNLIDSKMAVDPSSDLFNIINSYELTTKLLLYPIEHKLLNNSRKTYNTFNIDDNFVKQMFNNVIDYLSLASDDVYNKMFIYEYKIKDNKVYSIKTRNFYNVKHVYNNKYELKQIIFCDNTSMKISNKK